MAIEWTFGHCEGFMIYEIENGEILNHKFEFQVIDQVFTSISQ